MHTAARLLPLLAVLLLARPLSVWGTQCNIDSTADGPGNYDDGNNCQRCTPGHYCPAGQTTQVECAGGTYQPDEGQAVCRTCPVNHKCPGPGTVDPLPCGDGNLANEDRTSCTECTNRNYYLNGSECVLKTLCDPKTEFEPPVSGAYDNTQNRVCQAVRDCDVTVVEALCVTSGDRMCRFHRNTITRLHNASHDRVCEMWEPCPPDNYVYQFPQADDEGFLTRPQLCKPYKPCVDGSQYVIFDPRKAIDIHGNTLTYPPENQVGGGMPPLLRVWMVKVFPAKFFSTLGSDK